MQGNQSDVARLLAQISAEYEAAERGLTGLSMGNARHDFIIQRMETMSNLCTQLYEIGGEEAAKMALAAIDAVDNSPEQKAI